MNSHPTFTAWADELRSLLADPAWVDQNIDALHHLADKGWTPTRVAELMQDQTNRGEMARRIFSTLRNASEVIDLQRLYGLGGEPEPPKH